MKRTYYILCPYCGMIRWPLIRDKCQFIQCHTCGDMYLQTPLNVTPDCEICNMRLQCLVTVWAYIKIEEEQVPV